MNTTELTSFVRNEADLLDYPRYNKDGDDPDVLYEVPVGVVILLSIFYGSISIIAVIGNSLVIWIVATTRQMQSVTNLFIANLALADVIIGMFAIPFQFQAALLQRWDLPDFMCAFCPFVQTVSVNVSVFTLTAVAIDRHRAVLHPLRARPPKYISKMIIAFIWIISILFSIPMAVALRVIQMPFQNGDLSGTYPFCDVVNLIDNFATYRYYLSFVQYFIPFGVISFVYIQMAIRLWGSKTPGNAQDSRDVTLMRNKKRVIKMLIIVVLLFGICWFPLQLYNILHVTFEDVDQYKYINILWFCSDWLAMSNSCYNPFIYGIYNEKFKREFRRRFPFFRLKFDHAEISEKNVSMYTRASSIRSNYTTSTSSKGKFMVPQRIIGTGTGSIQQHNNTLHMTDTAILKNNNVVNAHCATNNNWNGTKSPWLFNQTAVIGNNNGTSVVEWRDDRKHCMCLPKVCYKNGHATNGSAIIMKTAKHSKNYLYDMVPDDARDMEHTCCCCQPLSNNNNKQQQLKSQQRNENGVRRISNTEIEHMYARGAISPLPEGEDDDNDDGNDDGDGDDVDFRKSIIRINNIYNSCRDMTHAHANDSETKIFMNNTKLSNDILL